MKKRDSKSLFMLLVMAFGLLLTTVGYAQKKGLYDVKLDNLSLKEALIKISTQCGYYFVYEDADLAGAPRVNKEFKQSTIEQILSGCLEGSQLTYSVNKKNVYIKKAAPASSNASQNKASATTSQQNKQGYVTGRVTDVNGDPLPGAYIKVKEDPTAGTSSDADGNYRVRISDFSTPKTLVISYVGMQEQEINVGGRQVIDITLREEYNKLDQIVVVGYGAVRKKDIAGSVQNVTSDQISETNNPTFEKALQGRVSGVQIISNSGIPGGSVSISIRGRGSINAGTQPLYIIDGVQMTNGGQSTSVVESANVMGGINPNDIESITVLKDGASASIYGAQAANGVVIITTKRGAEGKTRVSFSASVGAQKLARKVKVMTGPQWAEFALEEYKNYDSVWGTNYYQQHRDLFKTFGWGEDGYSDAQTTDWYKEIFRTAISHNYELGVSGGNEKTRFYMSGNYNKTDGVIRHTGYTRATGRVNLAHDLTKWLTISTKNTFSRNNYNQASTVAAANPSRAAMFLNPGVSPRDEDGNWIMDLPYGYPLYNIPQMLELNEYNAKVNNLISSNDLTFKFMEGLEFKSSYNVDYTWINEHQYSDPRTRLGNRQNGVVSAHTTDESIFQTDQVLTYNTELGKDRLTAMAGFSYRDSRFHSITASAIGAATPGLHLLDSAPTPQETGESFSESKLAGFFARVNYALRDKYIFTGTLRYDGSSRFGKDNRWGWFPSFSFAWRAKEEDFLKDVDWLSDLKLRASYGVTGNSSISNYGARRLYSGGYAYDGMTGLIASSIGNPKLSWEKKHSKNVGVTAGFFKGRITFDFDVYRDDTKNLLYSRSIPETTGFSSISSNMGGVKNEGFDFQLNTINIDRESFRWETNFNISYTRNAITKLQDGLDQIGSLKVGKPIMAEFVYKWAGVNASDGRPMYYDKDGYITYNPSLADRYWIRGRDPKWYGGMLNTLTWKGFTLSFFFQFQAGAVKYWSDKTVLIGQAADNNLFREMYFNYWRNPGDITWVPRPFYNGSYPGSPRAYDSNTDPGMSLIYEKTDFIKLKNINFSYDFPKATIRKIGLEGLQLFVNAYNIWTTTPYQGYDPESVGNDRGLYPQSKSISFGLKLNF
jgi:TonB-linked SusC/RagA family outer membrane protein